MDRSDRVSQVPAGDLSTGYPQGRLAADTFAWAVVHILHSEVYTHLPSVCRTRAYEQRHPMHMFKIVKTIDRRHASRRTLPFAMEGSTGDRGRGQVVHRVCARRGCGASVNKPTAKYCSVRCCAIDPERHERLRVQARRASARPLTMAHQLSFNLQHAAFDPEAQLAQLCQGRDDIPAGMSRLIG